MPRQAEVLVNNAGIPGAGSAHDPEHATLDDWRAVHRTNLDGVFLGCKHALWRSAARRRTAARLDREHSSRSGAVGVAAGGGLCVEQGAVRTTPGAVGHFYCAEQGLPVLAMPSFPHRRRMAPADGIATHLAVPAPPVKCHAPGVVSHGRLARRIGPPPRYTDRAGA